MEPAYEQIALGALDYCGGMVVPVFEREDQLGIIEGRRAALERCACREGEQ